MNRITSLMFRAGGYHIKQWNINNVDKISQKLIMPSVYLSFTGVNSNLIVNRSYSDRSNTKDTLNNLPLYDEKKGKLIYSGILTKPVKGAKIFSLSTSLIGLGLLPYVVFSLKDDMLSKIATAAACTGFILITPIMMHFITKKYIISIYYNEETKIYTATSFSFFVRKKEHIFTSEDVDLNPGVFSSITVKGFPLLLDESRFLDASYCYEFLSLHKPISDFIKKDKE